MTFLDQKRPDMQTWTDDRVERLKKLWADGLSASQIAGELGGITRNAVIGKVHRLGLSGRAKAPSSSMPRQRKPRAPSMFRAPRPMMRGNTALAHMPAYDYDPDGPGPLHMYGAAVKSNLGERIFFTQVEEDVLDAVYLRAAVNEEFLTDGKGLGYDEAKAGESFVKIGVGAIRKPDEPRWYRLP